MHGDVSFPTVITPHNTSRLRSSNRTPFSYPTSRLTPPPSPKETSTTMQRLFLGARSVALAAAVGNMLQGWDNSAIAGALLYIKPEFKLENNPILEGLMVASTMIAAIVSTVAAGPTSDWLGRRAVLLVSSMVYTIGSIVMVWSPTVHTLVCGRLLIGAAIGLAVTTVPILIAECAPTSIRGQLATLPQLSGSTGQFLAYCVVFTLSLYSSPNWRLMLGILFLPSLAYVSLCIFFLPESPRWLVSKGRMSEAKQVLQRVYVKEDVTAELALLVEGLGVGIDTSFEEYILKPAEVTAIPELGAPKLEYITAEEGEGILLYEPEHSLSWIAKPLVHEDQGTGFLSRTGSFAGSGISLVDPTVALLGDIQNNLDSLADQLHPSEGEFGEPHWDEEEQPISSPTALRHAPVIDNHIEEQMKYAESISAPLLVKSKTRDVSSGSIDIPAGALKKTSSALSTLSRASRISTMEHPSVADIFGSTENVDGAWQLAWQWEQQGENQEPQFKRVFLLPENPEQLAPAEVEGVPAAAFVSQPALLVTEVLGEEPSGPAMVHPAEAAVPGPLWSEFTEIGVKRALVVGMGLQVLQQFSGINAVIYYTPQILSDSGIDVIFSKLGLSSNSSSLLASGVVCFLMLPCILLAMRLMDRTGRRYLLLMTIPLLVAALLVFIATKFVIPEGVTAALTSLVCLAIFTCSFVTGLGPVPNIVCSEIFPTRVRGVCLGLCTAVMWISNIVISNSFPILLKSVGLAGAFSVYAMVTVFSWFFVFVKVPETKGVPLEVISEIFAYQVSSDAALKIHRE